MYISISEPQHEKTYLLKHEPNKNKSFWISAQSDQHLSCLHEGTFASLAIQDAPSEDSILIILHKCAGRSESLLGTYLKVHFWFGLEFNSPVNIIKVMLNRSVYQTTLFLGRLSPLSG